MEEDKYLSDAELELITVQADCNSHLNKKNYEYSRNTKKKSQKELNFIHLYLVIAPLKK